MANIPSSVPPPEPKRNLVQRRPAETGAPVATVIALLIAKLLGVEDADTVAYLAVVLAFVPAAITWMVTTIRARP